MNIIHIPQTSTIALLLTIPKICEVLMRQKTKRQVNAFLMYVKPTHPSESTSAWVATAKL